MKSFIYKKRSLLGALILFLINFEAMPKQKEFVLIGASIGRAWHIQELPKRKNFPGVKFEYIGVFDTFDKTQAIQKIINRTIKPDVVIIKECSIFFPGPLEKFKKLAASWIETLQQAGIRPVLATIVPVAKPRSISARGREWIRGNILRRESRIEHVLIYNEWVRKFSQDRGLRVLDLEQAVRVSERDRYMRSDVDMGDRIHLNAQGYMLLDAIMAQFLSRLEILKLLDRHLRV